ncbi:MAG: tRNA (adenosine(37)-N6)-threonylcarbamoyltransferase complex ATPase subunit type 1 TsaE [Lachnospiraceae bacterium]|nr:tRNA (adenosine(37)-N6)-threonylcarbamoyltransferase complex ATPase subunit type 1 TsaE [Lachnospiraceae bacterium]
MERIETFSEEETFALGEKIGREAHPGQIYTLLGDLGVGKTVFTQGVARGLGISECVCSPTFTIVQVYEEGRIPFYHFDVYRIGDIEEMDEIGYEDYFYGEGICLIEWANLIDELIPKERIQITIQKNMEKGFSYREITIERGMGYEK